MPASHRPESLQKPLTTHAPMLLSARRLVAIVIGVLSIAGLLYSVRKPVDEILVSQQTDAISISYLEQLIRIHPKDWGIRHQLVTQLYSTGQYQRAWAYLSSFQTDPLPLAENIQWRVMGIRLTSVLSFNTAEASEQRKRWRETFLSLVAFDHWHKATINDLMIVAGLANDLGAHDQAIELYTVLGSMDIERGHQWWAKAAEITLSQNHPYNAADLYVIASQTTSDTNRQHHYLQQAIAGFLYAEAYEDALRAGVVQASIAPNDTVTLLQVSELALKISQFPTAIEYIDRALASSPTTPQLERLQQFSLQAEATYRARSSLERLHRRYPDRVDYRRSLATVYEWLQQPEKALDHWLWISKKTGDRAATAKARALAIGLFDSPRLIDLLEYTAGQRALTADELYELVETLENLGEPERAEQFLRGYLVNQRDALGWQKLAKNLQDRQQFQQAIVVWKRYQQQYPLTQHDLFEYAYILQATNRSAELLALLLPYRDRLHTVPKGDVPRFSSQADFEKNYWLLLANTSWLVEDIPVMIDALKQAVAYEPQNPSHYDRYLSLGNRLPIDQRRQMAQQSFDRFQQADHGLILLEIATAVADWPGAERILHQLHSLPQVKNDCRLYYYQALLDQHSGRLVAADSNFQQSIACSGQNPYFLATYLYFLIAQDQAASLRRWLEQWHFLATLTPSLWTVYAQAWSALGDTYRAQHWYQQAIEAQPDDLLLQLAYADFLDFADLRMQAWHLRRQVLAQLSERSLSSWLPDDRLRPYLLPLHTRLYGLAQSNDWLARAYQHDTDRDTAPARWLPSIVLGLIEASDLHASEVWRQIGASLSVDFDAAILVSLALQGDRERLYQLFPQTPGGPLRTEALIMMGESGHALDYALGRLEQYRHAQWHNELLRQSVALTVEAPGGFRILLPLSSGESGTAGGFEYTLARRLDEWHLQLDGQVTKSDDESSLFIQPPASRFSQGIQGTYWLDDGYLRGTTYLTESDGTVTVGAEMGQRHQWDNRWSGSYSVAYQVPAEQTRLQEILLNRSGLNLAVQHQPSPRTLLTASVRYDTFTDIYDNEKIGHGLAGQGNWNYQLLADYPEWIITTGIDWQHYRAADQLGQTLSRQMVPGAVPADLINEHYLRYNLSNRWQRGNVGALNARAPTPQWFLGLNTGYQIRPESTFEYSLEAGIGWRIFGDDELALSTTYARNTLQNLNGADYQFQVSYQYRFGH